MLSPVSLTPTINCLPVSRTPPINCIDDRGLLVLQNYLRPPKSATANDIVIGTAMKTRKGTSQTLIRGPGARRPPKLLQTKTALFSFDGLRGLWSRCVGCFWMQLFMAVPMTPSAAVADFGGQRYRRFIPFNFLLSLAAPHLHGLLVLVTGNKFIAGIVVTSDNCSPVSLSPATKLLPVSLSPVINCSPVSTTPAITENPWQRLIAGVNDTGNKFSPVSLTLLNSLMW